MKLKVLPYKLRIIHHKKVLILLLAFLLFLRVDAVIPYSISDSSYCDATCTLNGKVMFPRSSSVMTKHSPEDDLTEPNIERNLNLSAEPKGNILLSDSQHTLGSRIFLSTNLLYDAILTPNIGIGISVTDKVTVFADWMYARWSNRAKRRYWRIYGGDIEVRYHLNHRKNSPLGGHHIGAYASLACYDFQKGLNHRGVLSDKYNYAAGISYTYSLPVARHFNIDFSLGVGYMWGTYKKHTPIDDCDVWLFTHKLGWFGPTKAGISLVWLIGSSVINNRKGGDR